jgi:hypothetical protein
MTRPHVRAVGSVERCPAGVDSPAEPDAGVYSWNREFSREQRGGSDG